MNRKVIFRWLALVVCLLCWTSAVSAATLDEALNVEGGTIHFFSTGDYPWQVVDDGNGSCFAQSGNAGVHGSTSVLTAYVTVTEGTIIAFNYKAWGEGQATATIWDKCEFAVDGEVIAAYGAEQNVNWAITNAVLSAGTHTLTWSYTKDTTLNPEGDYFAIDNVVLTAPVPVFIDGDVNGDTKVNITDVTMLINLLSHGTPTVSDYPAADFNGDGQINISDVTKLINYLLLGMGPAETFTVAGVSFTMVPVKAGTFTMGATNEQLDDATDREKPAHQVTLTRNYSICETEVTQALWLAVMGSNPSGFTGDLSRPVEQVSWNDCQTFIAKLNLMTGQNFRLPTEAEWEYAARGGDKGQGFKYAGSNDIDEVAWYSGNAGGTTHPVATKAPNELGLYDMSGNVLEWCQDWYGRYSAEAQTDPTGPETGSDRVYHSGCFDYPAHGCRVSFRYYSQPTYAGSNRLGLRLAQ
jgi:formylglycine-generating enzyme required for sulfatase activity